MDYDEIIRKLNYTINTHKDKFVGTFETNIYDMARDCKWYIEQQQKEIEALKPQPDSETGLMPCGCGGKAEIRKWEWSNDTHIAGCTVCDANVDFPYNIDETDKIISDWNRAMGRRTEE